MRAQSVDQHRQRSHGHAAVAAAIVQQDDAAAELRLGLHRLQLFQHVIRDGLRGLALPLVPVPGIDLVAHDGVTHLLDEIGGRRLVVGIRLLVDGVGRTEEKRLDSQLAAKQAFGKVQLQLHLAG